MNKNEIRQALKWRYAVKEFDETKPVSEDKIEALKEVIQLSASSYGLQPYQVVVVSDKSTLKKLSSFSVRKKQVASCSHLFVLCTYECLKELHITTYVNTLAKERAVSFESLAPYKERIMEKISLSSDEKETKSWMEKQVYLALGKILFACASLQIDSCPMEGYDKKKIDSFLELKKVQLESVLLCPVGYRSKEDEYQHQKKVRKEKKELFVDYPLS